MQLRPIEERDWPAIMAIQEQCYHAIEPEPLHVMQSKWQVAPQTCLVVCLDSCVMGYCLAHPWLQGHPPALNQVLTEAMPQPDTLYLHDMALSQAIRGQGGAQQMLNQLKLLAQAQQLNSMSLIAIQGAASYWQAAGFIKTTTSKCLGSYCDDPHYMVMPL
ncbi:GNAT family N-acetyltransferase [Shewanella sp. NIFS-20-20]|uniref:GNAT family N-acetyltransferase n=1 Tax=Shewanella sp. NIFS-20-20 TaxID=2853806 RepID=UPI001C490194|nr:GNAT family N-acetyltransferase [Shewanella sp. NIFS-20-20]MBV7314488.1 GNAT family N-acetyltransferase [Shewanella sp. NIFS-20-20]